MTNGTALWKGDTWNPGWGELSLGRDGVLSLSTPDGVDETRVEQGDRKSVV